MLRTKRIMRRKEKKVLTGMLWRVEVVQEMVGVST